MVKTFKPVSGWGGKVEMVSGGRQIGGSVLVSALGKKNHQIMA